MRAFEIYYKTGGTSGLKEIVLAENEEQVPYALQDKAPSFSIDGRWDAITRMKEIPLTKVRLKDLSITEFQQILKGE